MARRREAPGAELPRSAHERRARYLHGTSRRAEQGRLSLLNRLMTRPPCASWRSGRENGSSIRSDWTALAGMAGGGLAVVGIERSEEQLARAERDPLLDLRRGDVTDPPLRERDVGVAAEPVVSALERAPQGVKPAGSGSSGRRSWRRLQHDPRRGRTRAEPMVPDYGEGNRSRCSSRTGHARDRRSPTRARAAEGPSTSPRRRSSSGSRSARASCSSLRSIPTTATPAAAMSSETVPVPSRNRRSVLPAGSPARAWRPRSFRRFRSDSRPCSAGEVP